MQTRVSITVLVHLHSHSLLVIVQLLSLVRPFATPWTAGRQATLSFAVSWSLRKLMSMESMTPSNHLILCYPLYAGIFF